jgi:hypothetical protein
LVLFELNIGSLSVNLAYPEQINEIASFLANRAQFACPIADLKEKDLEFLDSMLGCLREVIKRNEASRETKRISIQPAVLSYALLTPLLIYFQIEAPSTALI